MSSTPRTVVLVVDDDEGIREALHLILDDEYSVLDAAHGQIALDIVRARRVDVVLLDILMPEIDGLEILQELKILDPDLPVVMVTAVKTVRTTVAAMKLGAADYVTKPFFEDELLITIRRALEQRPSLLADSARTKKNGLARLPRTNRLLVVGGDPGWRAMIAVALARVSSVETSASLLAGLNHVLRFRPTTVVLNIARSSAEAGPFLRALHAQLPACPALIITGEEYLGGMSDIWETLTIRGVMRPPIDPAELLRRIHGMFPSMQGDTWPRLGDSVSRVVDCISRRFNESLTVKSLAKLSDLSASHLAHLFRAEIGTSAMSYLMRVRVAVAQELLAQTDDKLETIATRVGFGDTSHLSRVFHRATGRPPGAYRRSAL